MDEDDFLAHVRRAFEHDLAEGSLRLKSHSYRPEAFGNATAVLEAPELLLMLSRDRSRYYAYVAHPQSPREWAFLQMAITAAAGRSRPDYYHPQGHEIEIDSAAELFRSHRSALVKAYRDDRWGISDRLRLINEDYQGKMIKWHSSPEGKRAYAELSAKMDAARANMSPEQREVFRQLGLLKDS